MKFFGLEIKTAASEVSLREEMSLYKRTLEDIGWINLSMDQYSREELIAGGFHFMLKRCRIMYVNNPLCKHWVHLTTSFVFGRGLSAPTSKDSDCQEIINDFWEDPDNKKVCTSVGPQRMLSNKFQYEGNLFFMLFDDEEGNIRVRMLNCIEVVDIITDPEDRNKYLFYKVSLTNSAYDFKADAFTQQKTQFWYIPDIDNETPNAYGVPANKLKDDCRVFHTKINCDINDKFGVPDLYAGLDWVKAHKDMAGDMATLVKALSQFAWKKKIKGGAAQVSNLLNSMKATSNLTNVSTMAGKTQIENQGVDLESIDIKTGGVDIAEQGLKAMQMMVCSASGIFYHYYGDPSTGNLATATSMELPMIKKFEDYQMLWTYIFTVIITYCFRKKIEVGLLAGEVVYDAKTGYTYINTPKDLKIAVDFPPIIEDDIQELATALQIAKTAGLISDEMAARTFLLALEIDDIDEEVDAAMADQETNRALNQPKQVIGEPPNRAPLATVDKQQQNNYAAPEIQEALRRLMSVLREDNNADQTELGRHTRKNNYLNQRLNGYKKALMGHFKTFQKNVKDNAVTKASGDKYVGHVKDLGKHITKLSEGMKMSAKTYFPEAVKIGEKYMQSYLQRKQIKVEETLYEKAGKADKVLSSSISDNSGYIDNSLTPDINSKIQDTIKGQYSNADEFAIALSEAVSTFESRIDMYAGYLWNVEEKAVKEAGVGTGAKVNFIGPDDERNCDDCAAAVEGGPYDIDDAPQPGELSCMTNCRHALQGIE